MRPLNPGSSASAACGASGMQSPDGDDPDGGTYAQMIHAGDEVHVGAGQRFRVLDVVPYEEEDEVAVRGAARSRSRLRGRLTRPCPGMHRARNAARTK